MREKSHVSGEDIYDFLENLGEEEAGFNIVNMIEEVDENKNGTIEVGELIEVNLWRRILSCLEDKLLLMEIMKKKLKS